MPASNDRNVDVPTLSLAERDRRWNLARAFMERENLEALIVFGEHEDAGAGPHSFDTWFTNDRAGMIVIFSRDGELTAFVPMSTYINTHLAESARGDVSWFAPAQIRVGQQSGDIAKVLNERGLTKGAVGVLGLEPNIPWLAEGIVPYRLWNAILEQFPGVEFKPVEAKLALLMMPLSQEEVAVVRHSASIGDAMAHAMVGAARPGVSETEVFKAGMAAAHERGTTVPWMHLWTGPEPTGFGPAQWAYRPQAPRILQEGDLIATEVFCRSGMLQTQHQVMIAIGEVHEDYARAASVARACYDAGLKTLQAKTPFGDVAEAMLKPLEDAGGWVRGPQIHGLNPYGSLCRYPGDLSQVPGADQYPHVEGMATALPDMPLQPGMTFAFEPSCGFGSRLVCMGGTVIVGEDGPIELNPYTAQLLRAGA